MPSKWFVNLDGIFEPYPESLQGLLAQIVNRKQNVRIGNECRAGHGIFLADGQGKCLNCGFGLERHGRVFCFDTRLQRQTDLLTGREYAMKKNYQGAAALETQLLIDVMPSTEECDHSDAIEATKLDPIDSRPLRLDLICGSASTILSGVGVWSIGQPRLLKSELLQAIVARSGGICLQSPTEKCAALIIVRGEDPKHTGLVSTVTLRRTLEQNPSSVCVDDVGLLRMMNGSHDAEIRIWANDTTPLLVKKQIAATLDTTPRGIPPLPTRFIRQVCTHAKSEIAELINAARKNASSEVEKQKRWLGLLQGATPAMIHELSINSRVNWPFEAPKNLCLRCGVPSSTIRHSEILSQKYRGQPMSPGGASNLVHAYKAQTKAMIGNTLTVLVDLESNSFDLETSFWARGAGICLQNGVGNKRDDMNILGPGIVTLNFDVPPLERAPFWWELDNETLHLIPTREHDMRAYTVTRPTCTDTIRRLTHSTRTLIKFAGNDQYYRNRRVDPSGLKWRKIHGTPISGEELTNERLAEALATASEFTQVEWDAFDVKGLRTDHFIRSHTSYYQPVGDYKDRNFVELTRTSDDERLFCVQYRATAILLRMQAVKGVNQRECAIQFAQQTEYEWRAMQRLASARGWTLTKSGLFKSYPPSEGAGSFPLEQLRS